MEIYTQVPDKVTRDALRRLRNWLDHDEDQGDEVSLWLAVAVQDMQEADSKIGTGL